MGEGGFGAVEALAKTFPNGGAAETISSESVKLLVLDVPPVRSAHLLHSPRQQRHPVQVAPGPRR